MTELADALRISAEFKKAVNERYRLLEIDLDSIFQRLLLLQKKKYAAIKVEDGTRTTTEVKGLDMKRREYCVLSKTVSQYVPLSLKITTYSHILDIFWTRFYLEKPQRMWLKIFMNTLLLSARMSGKGKLKSTILLSSKCVFLPFIGISYSDDENSGWAKAQKIIQMPKPNLMFKSLYA